jgi:tetratricopeptide (TPR) repeat protein
VLQEYVRANPDVQRGHFGLGDLFSAWGKWDEALAEYDKATALEPGNPQPMANTRSVYIATERWPDLEAVNAKLLQLSDPRWKYAALSSQAVEQLYKGRRTDALRLYDAAIAALGPRGSTQSAGARMQIARLLMDNGEPAAALVSAQRAFDDAGGAGGFGPLSLIVQLHARLGHKNEVVRLDEDLTRRRNLIPSDLVKQASQHGQAGMMALERHDVGVAIQEMRQVEALVQAQQPAALPSFELASAYVDSGNDTEAAARFDRIVKGGTQRANSPLDFVRSLYFLGRISERKGERDKAREYYRRFVQYWGEGEIDREKVAEARKKLN